MGRKKRRKNATFKKQWYKMLDDHWARESKMRMKQILGQDPNTIKPVTGTIDGRDWRTYFPQPCKSSGFSWLEFTRRVEALQKEKNEAEKKEMESQRIAQQSNNNNNTDKNSKIMKNNNNKKKKDINDIIMKNPYKTVNNDIEEDDDDKW